MSDQVIMSKKRIVLAMEGLQEPQNIAWYRGTPHQDILMAIRGVSAYIFGDWHPLFDFLIPARQARIKLRAFRRNGSLMIFALI